VIHARGLRREFGRLVAVDDVSLDVPAGSVLALLGPNGAGKTTTVRLLAGLLAPSAGEASVAGCDVRTDAAGIRARVGLVTDSPGLLDRMTPVSYLDFFGRINGLDAATRRRRIDELLGLFELHDFRHARMAGFSRGMQQKVALARALLHEPSVVFLDEPTAGLDPLSARVVRELIVGLKQANRGIVLCTHDLDEAERLADTVAILRRGRVVALDTPAALRASMSSETLVQITLASPCVAAVAIASSIACVSHPVSTQPAHLTYRTTQPTQTNPQVIANLVAAGAKLISVTCTSPSLEDVYATALAPAHVNGTGRTAYRDPRSVTVASVNSAPVPTGNPLWETASERAERMRSGARPSIPRLPGEAAMTWLIARRAALEALQDRLSLVLGLGIAVVGPIGLLFLVVQPTAGASPTLAGAAADALLESALAIELLIAGLMPTVTAVGIASGQFAGEKERGILTPLLASPASNLAIFAGKILGSVIPPLLYATLAQVVFVTGVAILLGLPGLSLLPLSLGLGVLVLVPAVTCFAVAVASLISSRVKTYNAAQQLGGLVLMPLWGVVFGLVTNLQRWGQVGIFVVVLGLLAIDVVLILAAAATWRREEVLSQ
jgi:ABC-2 type transport system ATP-binding protein